MIATKQKNQKHLIFRLFLLLSLPLTLIGLFFITKTSSRLTKGEIDLSDNTYETVYLFGEWKMQPLYVLPQNFAFDDAAIYSINSDKLSDDIQYYSLQAAINSLDSSDYCLNLYNVKYVDCIYIDNELVYSADDNVDLRNQFIKLNSSEPSSSFTITLWITNISDRQKIFNPITLFLTHESKAYNQYIIRIVVKYLLEGIYFAFAMICLIMFIKNKTSVQFLLFAFSGLIRLMALEMYLGPNIFIEWIGLSSPWAMRISMVFIALACTLNVGAIYIFYKDFTYKKFTVIMLIIVSAALLLTLIFGNIFALALNISGIILYIICLISVGRAWLSNQKSAGSMFVAFLFYLLSLPFFFGIRTLAVLGSTLSIYNFVCPLGELVFYIVTLLAFFIRYADNHIKNIAQIRTLDTQLSDKEQNLSEAYKKLSDFEAARTRIFRDLAHDLRTPVTSVLGYLSMMAAGEISDTQEIKKISGKMLLRIRQIKDMTNSISGLTTLEQGKIIMQLEPCSVSDILKMVRLHYEQKCVNAEISFLIQENCGMQVLADIQQIMRVFDNLISNAIQYTPQGGNITISAQAEGEMARFSIKDTGCGISQEHLPHVFERFYRIETSRSENAMHQGLGLAICFEIIKAHNGILSVESDEQKGSNFSFTLIRFPEEQ